ncbi:MAG: hypothetical protein IJA80_07210 [Clostridia bacterium]|nr:hypothetical protein [Clostridia bacterium]
MTFRKNCLLFYEVQITFIILLLLALFLIPAIGLKYTLLIEVFFLLLILLNFKVHNEYITINETGIVCFRNKKVIWEYKWDSIVELRRSSRYLLPSIEIIISDSTKRINQFESLGYYFELNRKAKKAIKEYYKGTII